MVILKLYLFIDQEDTYQVIIAAENYLVLKITGAPQFNTSLLAFLVIRKGHTISKSVSQIYEAEI